LGEYEIGKVINAVVHVFGVVVFSIASLRLLSWPIGLNSVQSIVSCINSSSHKKNILVFSFGLWDNFARLSMMSLSSESVANSCLKIGQMQVHVFCAAVS